MGSCEPFFIAAKSLQNRSELAVSQVSDTIRDLTIRDPSPYVIILVNFYMCFVEQRSNDYIPLSVICVYFGLVNT